MKLKTRIPESFRFMVTVTILFLGISFGCNTMEQSPIVGTWQLDYSKSIAGDTLFFEAPGTVGVDQIKMWSENYFIFVGHYELDTSILDSGGGGTYTLEGNRYEEFIKYYTSGNAVGATVKMLLEIRNDTLIQTWPVDENGEVDSANYRIERYIRLD